MSVVFFLSPLFTALAMAAGLAHVFELLNRRNLAAEEYLIDQQIYKGWSLLGIAVAGSLLDVGTDDHVSRRFAPFSLEHDRLAVHRRNSDPFWTLTYPVNQVTQNWSVLPQNRMDLRD
jgi:hypothetical protein